MGICKPIHFWKHYQMDNMKTDVYICTDVSLATILDVQNGRPENTYFPLSQLLIHLETLFNHQNIPFHGQRIQWYH